jgi:hypothetical protein
MAIYLDKNRNASAVFIVGADGEPAAIGGGTGGGGDRPTGATADQVQGNVANGATDAGNPVKVGGVYRATPPTFTDGQRGDLPLDSRGNLEVSLWAGAVAIQASADNSDAVGQSAILRNMTVQGRNTVFNGGNWDRQRGDTTGTWVHNPPNTVSTALSGTIATSGATMAVTFTNSTRQEVINPSTSALWASWGTPAVNGAGSFPIAPGGSFSADRTAGTLTLLSTVATQPVTVNRYS